MSETSAIKLAGASQKLMKPKALVVTTYDGTEPSGDPKGKKYIIEEAERDSTSIAQDDNNETSIENEFSDSPLYNVITLGAYKFAINLPDTQEAVLVDILGFTKSTDGSKIYAPTNYTAKYIHIAVVYEVNNKKLAFVIPRLQVNPKFTAESLNSKIAGVNLEGTATDWDVVKGALRTPFYIDTDYTMPDVAG